MKTIKEKLLNKFLKIQNFNKNKEQGEEDKKKIKKLLKIMHLPKIH